ncbi:hypothetical protein VAE063_630005 [Vibrio aestuarianus]|uniref:Uncharacterized protein n=1 Tax=Vibrio aestuarianus TaxID=28171 RepID=A0ABM9FM63_9VIBR|nr:hypothetical protein VAE142_380005 [Vibrio aestuarianus]CAH8207664.1 hypothetical protein VAE063_630005 [Vibrio aestuarianus]
MSVEQARPLLSKLLDEHSENVRSNYLL